MLSVPLYEGRKQFLWFDAQHRRLQKWEVQDVNGAKLARMTLADYRTIQKQEFPFEILLSDLQGKQEAGIHYEHVEFTPPLPDSLFTFAPITGVKEIDLDATSAQ